MPSTSRSADCPSWMTTRRLTQPVTSFGGVPLGPFIGFEGVRAGGVRCLDGRLIVIDLAQRGDGTAARWEGEEAGYALFGGLWELEWTTSISFDPDEMAGVADVQW